MSPLKVKRGAREMVKRNLPPGPLVPESASRKRRELTDGRVVLWHHMLWCMVMSTRGLDAVLSSSPASPLLCCHSLKSKLDGKNARGQIRACSTDLYSTVIWDLFLLRFNFLSI